MPPACRPGTRGGPGLRLALFSIGTSLEKQLHELHAAPTARMPIRAACSSGLRAAAALLTPSPDPWTHALLALPMLATYALSIGIAWLAAPRRLVHDIAASVRQSKRGLLSRHEYKRAS